MKKYYKAITEFCWSGRRYARGEAVEVDPRSAKRLLGSRLIFEVSASSIQQDAAGDPPADDPPADDPPADDPPADDPPADDPPADDPPADEEEGKMGNDKKPNPKTDKPSGKQTRPPRDKQVTGGKNK